MTRALAGVRVLDASVELVGPVAAMLMADFGADVVTLPVLAEHDQADPGAAIEDAIAGGYVREGGPMGFEIFPLYR